MELEQIQLIAQLIDNIQRATDKLEKAYDENNSQDFTKYKQAILDFKQKINDILK